MKSGPKIKGKPIIINSGLRCGRCGKSVKLRYLRTSKTRGKSRTDSTNENDYFSGICFCDKKSIGICYTLEVSRFIGSSK